MDPRLDPRGGVVASKRELSVGRPMAWAGVAVLSAGLAAGSWFLTSSGIEEGVRVAQRRAVSTVKKHLASSFSAADVRAPMTEAESAEVGTVVVRKVLDPTTSTVRIWTPAGVLVYSSTGEPTGGEGGDARAINA